MRLRAFREFCTPTDGNSIFFGASQTRTMFDGSGARNVATIVRPITSQCHNGSSFESMPYLNNHAHYESLALLGSLGSEELNFREFCRRDGRWAHVIPSTYRCIHSDELSILLIFDNGPSCQFYTAISTLNSDKVGVNRLSLSKGPDFPRG